MKIALFSDIHANLPALEACLADIDSRQPDLVYCLGDLVGYNVWPNEVVEMIRVRRIPTIAGNYDYGVGRTSSDCGCAYKTERDREMGSLSIAYTNHVIYPDNRRFLRDLPAHMRIEFRNGSDEINLLLVHGSPRKINEYLFEDREERSLLRIMKSADADIMCVGHTHKPYHRCLSDSVDGEQRFRHAVNIGSVGKPKDGDAGGCYVMLTINDYSTRALKNSIHVEFIRFSYDVEKAARGIEKSGLPNEFADMLRKAY